MDEEAKKYHKTSVGGQALIEGIMMRGPKGSAMAVRLPNGEIETTYKNVKPWRDKCKFFGVPLIRGIVGFVESLVTGYGYLMESAEKSTQGLTEDEQDMSKFDRWLNDRFGPKMMNVIGVISSVLGFGLAFFLFMWLPSWLIDLVTGGNLQKFHPLFEGIVRIIIFVAYMALVSRMKDIHRVFMYHGAEHKTIFCYEHGLPLTVENVRKQSRFHPRCGTSFMVLMLIVGILVGLFVPVAPFGIGFLRPVFKILLLPVSCGIGYELIKICGKHDNAATRIIAAPGLWAQRITTKEPDDTMIEVAIEAIKAVIPEDGSDIVSK